MSIASAGLRRALVPLLFLISAPLAPLPAAAQSQIQLRCEGTLLEARGSAELKRSTDRLRFSLGLEAEAASANEALASLQVRLAAVRTALKRLQVSGLEVTSPSSWVRPASPRLPSAVTANLQVSGQLPPAALQPLIREVGSLSGVRLNPVTTEAAKGGDGAARRQLLKGAYQDALAQARELAAVIGLRQLTPIEVQLEGGARPLMLKAMAADGAPPFDPAELAVPTDRLALMVRFCAR